MMGFLPLAVDLDGTLIETDVLYGATIEMLKRHPFKSLLIPFWLLKNRAYFKKRLAAEIPIDPAALPYSPDFLAYLKTEKARGRQMILATATDQAYGEVVAAYVGLFSDVLASDGITNRRAKAKADALVARYGLGGFAYAGNSVQDLPVFAVAGEIIVVNAPKAVREKADALANSAGKPFRVF